MSSIFSVKPHQRLFTHIIIFLGACAMLVACIVAFYQQRASYEAHLYEGKENTARLTSALSGYIELSFLTVDLILHRASDKQYFNYLFGANLNDDMENNFKLWANEAPSICGMLVTDSAGVVKRTFYKEKQQRLLQEGENVRDQRYFVLHKMDDVDNVQVSPLLDVSEDTNNYIIISRTLTKLDGSFGGIIAAIVDVKSLTSMFRSIEFSSRTKLALLLNDGTVLAQFPTRENKSDFNTARFVASLAGAGREQVEDLGIIEEEIDSIPHIITLKKFSQLPLTLSLFVAEDDILKNWRASRNNYILFLGVFALFIAVTSYLALIIGKQVQKIKRSEKKALLSNQNTSKFITKMNYELRTPLNTIIGFSEMIHLGYFGALNEKQKERIYDIHICGTYLLEFVHDILDIIRDEEGKLVLSEVKLKIPPIIETVLRTVLPYARKEGVNVICEDGIETLPELRADERKLRQALLNLITNMVKYTPSGGMVAISGEMDSKGNMIINVVSKGITVLPEDFSLAFSMTEQLNSSDNEGGGLGLPLSKIFIERHGGQIKLQNAEGGGGVAVRVILPAERVL